MQIKKILLIAKVICIVFIFFSCEKITHTTYRIIVSNLSSSDIVVEYTVLDMDTVLIPWSLMQGKESIYLLDSICSEIAPKLSEIEFEQKVATLSVYNISNEGDKAFLGGTEDFCRKLSNWEYRYSTDYKYGMHEYLLIIED